jgi:hypothetical protein
MYFPDAELPRPLRGRCAGAASCQAAAGWPTGGAITDNGEPGGGRCGAHEAAVLWA